jgi:class 3 adenylate cyclase
MNQQDPTARTGRRAGTRPEREASTSRVEVRDLDQPEAVVRYPLGEAQQVRLANTVISRIVLQPGWNWLTHAKDLAGTPSCELYHRGVVLRGKLGIRTDDGAELVVGRNHVFDIRPGHVIWVDGDEELVMLDWAGGAGFGVAPGAGLRSIATILFTDIVDSTGRAQRRGDLAWKRTVDMHDDIVRSVLTRFGGRELNTAGDSFLILFDSAERAMHCGLALIDALASLGIAIRVGIHSGEVVMTDRDVRGVAVHIAARVVAQAAAGEVLVSRVARDLAEGGRGLRFEPRGRHRLKGVEGDHELFAATAGDDAPP